MVVVVVGWQANIYMVVVVLEVVVVVLVVGAANVCPLNVEVAAERK